MKLKEFLERLDKLVEANEMIDGDTEISISTNRDYDIWVVDYIPESNRIYIEYNLWKVYEDD